MDKVIHRHLDRRLDIQEEAAGDIDRILASLDLRKVLKDPKRALVDIGVQAMSVAEAHSKAAIEEGSRFAKEVRAAGEVVFKETADPKANKDGSK